MKEKKLYNSYNEYLKNRFGAKTYKISIDANFSCPNFKNGGCTFCNDFAFSPSKHLKTSIDKQIEIGIERIKKRYKNVQNFIAYLQPNTNTYGDVDYLYNLYTHILQHPEIKGLIIGTRPDCVDKEKIDMISQLADNHYISIEYGLQSSKNETLEKINRGHTVEDFITAMKLTENKNIDIGIHIIIGLPNEQQEDYLNTILFLNQFNYKILKIHNLNIIKGTKIVKDYNDGKIPIFSMEEYIKIVSHLLGYIKKDVIIGRLIADAPAEFLIEPKWVLEKAKFLNQLKNYMLENELYQGKYIMEGKYD